MLRREPRPLQLAELFSPKMIGGGGGGGGRERERERVEVEGGPVFVFKTEM